MPKAPEKDKRGKGTSSGKRKLDTAQITFDGADSKQQNIASLFAQTKEQVPEEPHTPSKRQKSFQPTSKTIPNTLDTMYNFPSKTNLNTFIDLTTNASPNKTPKPPGTAVKSIGFAPHTGAKKLVVKNIRTTPRVQPHEYYQKVWGQLDIALTEIFVEGRPHLSLEELYKGAENVCRQGQAPELYQKLKAKCQNHITDKVLARLSAAANSSPDIALLNDVVKAWSSWKKQLATIRSIFYYMDQSYLLRTPELPDIKEMGLLQFRKSIFGDKLLTTKILQGTSALMSEQRANQQNADHSELLQASIDTFHDLGIYSSIFEPALSDFSADYFNSWSTGEVAQQNLGEYAQKATDLVKQEMARCGEYGFDRSTRAILSDLIDEHVVRQQHQFLTDKDSLLNLFEDNDAKALRQVYNLLQRIGKGTEVAPALESFTVDEGSIIVFDEKRESEMVVRLLEFKQRLDNFLKFSFDGNHTLADAMHKSVELFINQTKKTASNWGTDNPKPGEMIAKHVDALLRGGLKAIPKQTPASNRQDSTKQEEADDDEAMEDEDAEINKQLDLVLDLFRYVHGKAVFEAFYKKDLARRLLMGRSASNDAERSMLQRLKNECGAGFTHNLESMFKDMDLAREEISSYNNLMADRGQKSGPDLHVNVLSAAAWPTYPDVAVNVPTSISKAQYDFEQHYKAKYNGRKLAWKQALAHCQLRARFPKGNKEIVVSGFQAIVLLLFNDLPDGKSLSYTDISGATALSDAELTRTLQSLACAKYRVLQKTPRGREVSPTDTFTYNSSFSDPKMRIKINQIQLKETREENKETHQRVAADRHYETQAAIVRIMKSRKQIRHAELVAEVITATKSRGVLDPSDIKKNIEKLIEKDYMEREDGGLYTYVA